LKSIKVTDRDGASSHSAQKDNSDPDVIRMDARVKNCLSLKEMEELVAAAENDGTGSDHVPDPQPSANPQPVPTALGGSPTLVSRPHEEGNQLSAPAATSSSSAPVARPHKDTPSGQAQQAKSKVAEPVCRREEMPKQDAPVPTASERAREAAKAASSECDAAAEQGRRPKHQAQSKALPREATEAANLKRDAAAEQRRLPKQQAPNRPVTREAAEAASSERDAAAEASPSAAAAAAAAATVAAKTAPNNLVASMQNRDRDARGPTVSRLAKSGAAAAATAINAPMEEVERSPTTSGKKPSHRCQPCIRSRLPK